MIRRLWAYWDGPQPPIVRESILSWKKHLPDWEINVLDARSVEQYPILKPASYDSLVTAVKTDVVRLSLLYLYGGLWIDASTLLMENLDWLAKYAHLPFYAFQLHERFVENWFLYAPRAKSPLLRKWRQTLLEILDTTPRTAHPAYSTPCTGDGSYFMMYQAFCYLVRTDPQFAGVFTSTPFPPALPHFYSPWVPLTSHKRLVKFTKGHRALYQYAAFPLLYVFVGVVAAVVVAFVVVRARRRS